MTIRFSLFLFWLVACASSKHSEIQIQQSKEVVADATHHEVVVTQKVTGPETVTTVIEEFAPATAGGGGAQLEISSEADGVNIHHTPDTNIGGRGGARPILVKRTTIVDQRGAAETKTTLNANTASRSEAATSTNSKTTSASKTRAGPDFFSWIAIACGGVLAVLLAIRFKVWRIAL